MLPVEQPFKTYTGLDGKPLDNGYVYFGQPNQNPITVPVTVYWDAAGTIPAAQPLRTVGGYIMRGGTPANVFIDESYSESVLDSKKRQVFYAATSNDFSIAAFARALTGDLAAVSGAAQIGFGRPETGAAALTLQEVARRTICTLDFITDPAERQAIVAGTSTVDHTAEIQKAIDAAGSQYRLLWLGTVNTGLISSAASVDWEFAAGAKVRQIPAVYAAYVGHVTLTGPRIRIRGGEFDGNQDSMVSGQGSDGLIITGISPALVDVKCHDYNGVNYTCKSANIGVKRGLHIGCSFDDAAGLGLLTIAACYHSFIGCTFDRNGYGFQRSRANYADTSHGFVAFGVAVRLRSHHIEFIDCHARDNGREGFNVNQGSYAIKFAQCLAYGNDDAGFSLAADNTGTGLAGEGEPCFDIEYVGCESYNNYTSGLVGYQSCSNVRVVGGRYYNNHRLAGNQAMASSYYNGIYFAGGSNGIDIDASVYDERQVRSITAIAGGVLTAAGWVPGTMNYYPKVAIYSGSNQSFKGYAKITAESAGSVTITPTSSNGVTLTSIAVGDYVSQAVQHNGVFVDNNTQGTIAAAGAGHRLGANSGTTGRLIIAGAFAGGQNILLPRERANASELLTNPTFDAGVTGWSYNIPSGGQSNAVTTAPIRSAGALQLIAGTSDAQADGSLVSGALATMAGEFVEFGIWSYASARNDAYVQLFWQLSGSYFTTTVQHPGGGWRYLKIGAFVPANATSVFPRLSASAGKTVVYDSASLRAIDLHADPREFTFPSRSLPY